MRTPLFPIAILTLWIASFLPNGYGSGAGEKPNVLLILTDDQGYGDMACHGNPFLNTPNIDALYRQSVRLTDFHVDPMCAPTRAALMTGRYSARTGVWSTLTGCYIPSVNEYTMGHLFSDNGYATGMFGKWHLGDTYPYAAEHRGFQHVVRHGAGVIGEVPDYWNNDYFDDTYLKNGIPVNYEGHCSEVWVNETIAFIKSTRDKPFFCYLAFNAPHGPMNVHSDYSDPYVAMGIPEKRAGFYGLITHLDAQLEKLMHYLEQSGKADNTIVIFMGDNGTSTGVSKSRDGICKPVSPENGYNAGMRDTKTSPYDGGHRNACFIRWPNGNIGHDRDIGGIAAHFDLMPTLVDLCQLRHPDLEWDGTSLATQLRAGVRTLPDRTLVVHNMQLVEPVKYKDFAVMTSRWRLVNTQKWDQPNAELFNIVEDPGQTTDVSNEFPEVVATLMAGYEKWWQEMIPGLSHVSRLHIGAKAENPVTLTSHSWRTTSKALSYNQKHVREGIPIDDAYWPIHVETSGPYRIELRRWPREANVAIRASIPAHSKPFIEPLLEGKAFNITSARLQVQEYNMAKPVAEKNTAIAFEVNLMQGKTELRASFTCDDNKKFNSYYVYVEKL